MHKPNRLIASVEHDHNKPTIIFFCCIHGNEKAGYVALKDFFDNIFACKECINGNIYAIFGNQEAYLQGLRFIDKDLNRIWTKSHIKSAAQKHNLSEYHEMIDIYNLIYDILNKTKSTVYSIDLHTTSGPTKPFIVMNDALNNRAFVRDLGYHVIFNVETFIEGSLLNLLNDLGHISLAFEGGEHYSKDAVTEIKNFCYKSLYFSGIIDSEGLQRIGISKDKIRPKPAKYYEMVFRQDLKPNDTFEMIGNYVNFQKVKKGERIALLNGRSISSPKNYQIFMPLYQSKGEDGFFYVKHINSFKLKVARILRNINAERLLIILPGVNKENFYTLSIPEPIVKYIPKRFLFALGYRKSIVVNENKICFTKQERKLKKLPELKSFMSPYEV